jgi:hypothetical protein
VGLLRLGLEMDSAVDSLADGDGLLSGVRIGHLLGNFIRRLLPDDSD